ncbi:hypothetical protein B0H14DRAFT_3531759 [Mycena olivaceomarginata]|nr:hypothetical protein B0H14DRAFT_3531759 [Mycena olivaceomarginata]
MKFLQVLELKKLNVPTFPYCHETVTEARIAGRNLVHEIRDCKTWNIICVGPEHLREKAWRQISAFDVFRAYGCADEAHLINTWGAEFRPQFRHIGAFFNSCLPSSISVMALSATGWIRPMMIEVAVGNPALIHVLDRLLKDAQFAAILSPIPLDRINITRGDIKRCVLTVVRAMYNLTGLTAGEVKTRVEELLKDHRYIFPVNAADQMQLPLPFHHGSIKHVLKEQMMSGPGSLRKTSIINNSIFYRKVSD